MSQSREAIAEAMTATNSPISSAAMIKPKKSVSTTVIVSSSAKGEATTADKGQRPHTDEDGRCDKQ